MIVVGINAALSARWKGNKLPCIFPDLKMVWDVWVSKRTVHLYDPQYQSVTLRLLQHLNRRTVKNTSALSSAFERDLLFAARAGAGSIVLGCRDTDLVPARGTESAFWTFPLVIIEDILRHDFAVDETFQVSGQHWHIFHPFYDRTLLLPLALQLSVTWNQPLQIP